MPRVDLLQGRYFVDTLIRAGRLTRQTQDWDMDRRKKKGTLARRGREGEGDGTGRIIASTRLLMARGSCIGSYLVTLTAG